MARAFDLQDTLVRINYNAQDLFAAIAQADKLYTPVGDFIVISAQPTSGAIRGAIRTMINDKYPNCTNIYFVSGSEQQVISAKARAIKNHSVTEFTDNNTAILKELSLRLPNVKFYKISNGKRTVFNG